MCSFMCLARLSRALQERTDALVYEPVAELGDLALHGLREVDGHQVPASAHGSRWNDQHAVELRRLADSADSTARGEVREREPDSGRIALDGRRQENLGPSALRGYAGLGHLTPPWSVERKCASPRRVHSTPGAPYFTSSTRDTLSAFASFSRASCRSALPMTFVPICHQPLGEGQASSRIAASQQRWKRPWPSASGAARSRPSGAPPPNATWASASSTGGPASGSKHRSISLSRQRCIARWTCGSGWSGRRRRSKSPDSARRTR